MKRFLSLLFVMLGVSVLAACTITIGLPFNPPVSGDPVTPEVFVDVVLSDPTSLRTTPLDADESVWFQVNINDSAAAEQAIYYEIDAGLKVELYSDSGELLATSSSDMFFETGGVSSSQSDLSVQIAVNWDCLGSCIIEDAVSRTRFLKVTNISTVALTFNLFVYAQPYSDEFEPGNDQLETAVPLILGSAVNGAIEAIGDVDFYSVEANGTLAFTTLVPLDDPPSANAIVIRAQVFDSRDREVASLLDGGTFEVFAGDYVRVSTDDGRAGSSLFSSYDFTLN